MPSQVEVFSKVDGRSVIIRNLEWIKEKTIAVSEKASTALLRMESDGKTVVCCVVDDDLIGLISLTDTTRVESELVV